MRYKNTSDYPTHVAGSVVAPANSEFELHESHESNPVFQDLLARGVVVPLENSVKKSANGRRYVEEDTSAQDEKLNLTPFVRELEQDVVRDAEALLAQEVVAQTANTLTVSASSKPEEKPPVTTKKDNTVVDKFLTESDSSEKAPVAKKKGNKKSQ